MRLLQNSVVLVVAIFSTSVLAEVSSSVSRYCVGAFCLDDPLSKHMDKHPVYSGSYNPTKAGPYAPDCSEFGLGLSQAFVIGGPGAISHVAFWATPSRAGEPVGSYFRIGAITQRFDWITTENMRELAQKIADRAKGGMVVTPELSNTKFSGFVKLENGDNVVLTVTSTSAGLSASSNVSRSIEAFHAQRGCEKNSKTTPNL